MKKVRRNPRGPTWEAWHGKRVKVKPEHPDEFSDVRGTIISVEGEYLRVKFDDPVYVRGVGMVRDDLFMPHLVRKIKRNPGAAWHREQHSKEFDKLGMARDRDKSFYAGRASSQYDSFVASKKLGVPNPRKRRRNPVQNPISPPGIAIAVAVLSYLGFCGYHYHKEQVWEWNPTKWTLPWQRD